MEVWVKNYIANASDLVFVEIISIKEIQLNKV